MQPDPHSSFVDIFHPRTSYEAGIIRETLKQEGINVYINNENFANTGMVIGTGMDTMKVMVPRTDADKARDLIEQLGFVK
ncbi:MAG: DUF2007 domain-containing protein [Verrucomicrobia bacterium]|nr:DUF2007 domain-containing protein [Verrucomicrobiota bacterium]MBU4292056.1 DUF2007 domain-containing protein [Verrucomicrobiota bacterium]MBU4428145.1 DUF2007 domain-containing protein [Verrucomicrobiota bacterium]MCG2678890.1 DUF2007 domain-containing protein [Kiritimatiellia bacterium]